MNLNLNAEGWADVATLGTLSLMWAVMLYFEIRRTWKWDALGRSLTVLTGCLFVSYSIATMNVLTSGNIWTPEVRWSTRVALIISGTVTIVVLALGRMPERSDVAEQGRERGA